MCSKSSQVQFNIIQILIWQCNVTIFEFSIIITANKTSILGGTQKQPELLFSVIYVFIFFPKIFNTFKILSITANTFI